jgi:hypothetical protein
MYINDNSKSAFSILCRFASLLCSILSIVFILSDSPIHAQTQEGRTLDDELLKGLKSQLKTDIERDAFGADVKKEHEKFQNRAGQGEADLGEQLQRELGAAAEKEDDNPMLIIARNMFEVRHRITQADTSPNTINMQKQIVSDLNLLIEQAKKSCGQCSSNASNSQNSSAQNPQPSSTSKSGANAGKKTGVKPATSSSPQNSNSQTRKADMEETQTRMKNLWGELPPHIRDQMQQIPAEEFIPKYEQQIEDYFRELSEGKKGAGK